MGRVKDMGKRKTKRSAINESKPQPYRVRLPGFIADEEVGLGEFAKRVMSTVGIKPCGGCKRRAAAFNRWMVFYGQPSR
jgi:hypothetical protein